jgi:death-on-curing protein
VHYVSETEVLAVHFVVVDKHFSDLATDADQRGVQNPSGLLSAVYAPRQTFDKKDLFESTLLKAAALMRSLVENHPFINGNKRTAVISTIIFLQDNGYDLTVEDRKLLRLAKGVALGMSIERIQRWLKKYTCQGPGHHGLRRTYSSQIINWIRSVR